LDGGFDRCFVGLFHLFAHFRARGRGDFAAWLNSLLPGWQLVACPASQPFLCVLRGLAAVVLGLDACRELLCNAHEVDAANRAQRKT